MFRIIAVTNRALCKEDFLLRIERLAKLGLSAILLREKNLSPQAYESLAKEVLARCAPHKMPCILHQYTDAAAKLGQSHIHLPLPMLEQSPEIRTRFEQISVSVHSVEQALSAVSLGADALIAGHIFVTNCKKGLPPRGIPFLEEICKKVSVPVYAIGGISPYNIKQVWNAGAAGACIMSALMETSDPEGYLAQCFAQLLKI